MEDKTDWIAHAIKTGLIKDKEDTGIGVEIASVAMKEHEGHESPPRMAGEQGYPVTKIK